MLKHVRKLVISGVALLGGLLLLVLIFQFRPISGEQKDIVAVDDYKTYSVQGNNFNKEMDKVRKDKAASDITGSLTYDISNCKINSQYYSETEVKSWMRCLEIASAFYNSDTMGYQTNGLPIIAEGFIESGFDSRGWAPVSVVPYELAKSAGTITPEMINTVGVQNYLTLGIEIDPELTGTLGILQQGYRYVVVADKSKVTGTEYDKIVDNNLTEKAKGEIVRNIDLPKKNKTIPTYTFLDETLKRKQAGGVSDRFNWSDVCNNFTATSKSAITGYKKISGLTINNQYQYQWLLAQYHNTPAIMGAKSVTDTSAFASSLGLRTFKSAFDIYAQMNDATLISNMKALIAEDLKKWRPKKQPMKPGWDTIVATWVKAGLKTPEGVDFGISNAGYSLNSVYGLIEMELIYSGN